MFAAKGFNTLRIALLNTCLAGFENKNLIATNALEDLPRERLLLISDLCIFDRLEVSDCTSPWGRSELPFHNSGWGKYKISVPDGNRVETGGIPLWLDLGIVGSKKFFII